MVGKVDEIIRELGIHGSLAHDDIIKRVVKNAYNLALETAANAKNEGNKVSLIRFDNHGSEWVSKESILDLKIKE